MIDSGVADSLGSNSKTSDNSGEVSFSGKGLKLDSETSAKEVVDAINNCPDMEVLCMEGNTVGVVAAKAIAKALEGQPHFKRALWRDMFTGRTKQEIPQALNFLSAGIQLANAQLTELELSDNAFGPVGVEGIVHLLKSPSCFTLKELRLNNNGLGTIGGKLLANALRECLKNSEHLPDRFGLRVLICGRNRLEIEGAKALAAVFKSLGTLEEVAMPQNGITHAGISALAESFAHNPNLRIINLNDNTFTEIGAKAFAQNLPKMSKLESINFGDCLIRNEGALALAAVIKDRLPHLKELHLGFNEISADGGLALVKAMDGKPLQKLELNGNCFGPEGCGEIQESLQSLGLADTLGSLSDDEEGGYDDSENEKDEDDHQEEDDDSCEVIENHKDLNDEKQSSEQQEVHCTVVEFLSEPNSQRLLALGKNRAHLILAELSNNPSFDEVLKMFIRVACIADSADEKTKVAVYEVSDALLEQGFRVAVKENIVWNFSNYLLVHLGLIKSEDKSFKPAGQLRGPFLTLGHCVSQPYFARETKDILQFFLSVPNNAVNLNDKSVHLLKQALFQA